MQVLRSGPAPPKYGSATCSPLAWSGPPKKTPDRGRVERVADAQVVGHLLHDVVGRRPQRVLDDTEHPLRLVVVRRQLGLPVGDVAPLGVLVERVERLVERVGVDERAAADPRAGEDQRVTDRVDALDAVAADLGAEQELLEVEGGLGEVLVLEARSGLESRRPCSPSRSAAARVTEPPNPDPMTSDVVVEGSAPSSVGWAVASSRTSGAPQLLHQAEVGGHHLRVGLVLHPEHRREPDQLLHRDRLRLGVAQDALAALPPTHAGLAHATHRASRCWRTWRRTPR